MQLGVDPTQCAVLLTEPPLTTFKDKTEIARIMFEELYVAQMQSVLASAVTLYAAGTTTGICFVSDEDKSVAVGHFKGSLINIFALTIHIFNESNNLYVGYAMSTTIVTLDDAGSIHEAIMGSIKASPIEIRRDLYRNIVLGGVTDISLRPAMIESVQKEIQARAPASTSVMVRCPDSIYPAFNGLSILSCLSSFETSWITQQEFTENRSAVLEKKKLN